MTAKPVVFLAFANDRELRSRYLRNLPEETRRLRAKLERAQHEGLCELLVRQNVTREELFAVFQSADYRDRVAVFHYGGHANGYALLLEEESGAGKAAHAEGLADLLGAQRGLRFVFLNGCATEGHARGLLDAGVAAVLVTSQKIRDEAALDVAGHFYASLGSGASLERAYAEAKAAMATDRGSAGPDEAAPEHWPWSLYIKEGADERIKGWNLPQAAGDPLFGLPEIPPGDLHECPYRHLQPFGRDHAELFFGRGRDIRALYERATDPHAAPILLLYGGSGVGKSSLLEAGLIPRLEQSHEVIYRRRKQDLGLWGTLLKALEADEEIPEAARSRWQQQERQSGKPLDVILDQVEEVFTQADSNRPEELGDFLGAVKTLLGDRRTRPQGKLVLGFRKEWQPELAQGLSERELPHSELYLRPLDRAGLIEAIAGPIRSQRLQKHYGLSIEKGLPESIADKLRDDPQSPLAPTLQVLLAKLWAAAKDRDPAQPHFDSLLYQALKRKGLLLGDYLDQQLKAIEKQHPQALQSGLVLDLLAYHTTARSTAEERSDEDLLREYAHQKHQLRGLIGACQAGYLLLPIKGGGTRLGHDTLGPLIRERFEESDRSGQRARRVLEGRAPDWADGKEGAPLDQSDLAQVEAGLGGMRILSADEARLVDASHLERDRRVRQRKLFTALGLIAVVAVTVAAVVAFWQSRQADAAKAVAEIQAQEAEREARIALSRQLTAQARSVAEQYPERALLLAVEALRHTLEADGLRASWAETLLRERLASTGTLPLRREDWEGGGATPVFEPRGRWLATGGKDGTLKLLDLASPEAEPKELHGHEGDVRKVAFDPHGRWMATEGVDGAVKLLDLASPEADPVDLRGHKGEASTLAFDPHGRWLVAITHDARVRLWELENPGTEAVALDFGPAIRSIDVQGRWLVLWGIYGKVRLMDLTNPEADPVELRGQEGRIYPLTSLSFDPGGRWLVATVNTESIGESRQGSNWRSEFGNSEVRLWDLTNPETEPAVLRGLVGFLEDDRPNPLAFDPEGNWLATVGMGSEVRLWNLSSPKAEPIILRRHEEGILALAFGPQGRWLATGGMDGAVRLSNVANPETEPVVLRGHEEGVYALAFDPQGRWLATGGVDGAVRLWNLAEPETEPVVLRGHEGGVRNLTFDPMGRWLVAMIAGETRRGSVRLWNLAEPETEPVVARGHRGHIADLDLLFDPQGRWLAATEVVGEREQSKVTLWDFANPEAEPVVLRGHEGGIYTPTFDPQGRWLAATEVVGEREQSSVMLWTLANPGAEPMVFRGHEGGVHNLAFDPLGRWMAATPLIEYYGEQSSVMLWTLANPETEPMVLRGHEGSVSNLTFDPLGRWLVTGGMDGTVRLWDLASPEAEPVVLRGHAPVIDPQGRWLAATTAVWGREQSKVNLWDLANQETEPVVLRGHARTFDPLGRWLVTTDTAREDGQRGDWRSNFGNLEVRLLDLTNPEAEPVVLRGPEGSAITLAFAPQGRWLLAEILLPAGQGQGQGQGQVSMWLWDLANPETEPVVLRGHDGYASIGLRFDPQGRWLAMGGEDGNAKLWYLDPPSEEPVLLRWHEMVRHIDTLASNFEGEDGGVYSDLAFDPQGRWLATVSHDGAVRLWDLRIEELFRKACRTAGRNLTRQEWSLLLGATDYRATCPEYSVPENWLDTARNATAGPPERYPTQTGERESSTERPEEATVTAYRAALEEYTRERAPMQWAMTQYNLGFMLAQLGEQESDTTRLEEAVAAFRAALEEYSRERAPMRWAQTQQELGGVLAQIGERESDTQRLEEAVTAYRAVLEEYSRERERAPIDWGMTQSNLGDVLAQLGGLESSSERLEEAVETYRAALEEHTRGRAPIDWAMIQSNLGDVLVQLGGLESSTGWLEEAVTANRAALEELTRERMPLWWARTQTNLGGALGILGQRESGTRRLEEAVAAFRAALQEYTRAREPLEWARTQANLGNALGIIGQREPDTRRLEEAVAAYRAALEEYARERAPLEWASIQNNLGNALAILGQRESGTTRLEEAAAANKAALEEFTRERAPLQWARSKANQGIIFAGLGERESGIARLEEAVTANRAALQELTRERVPLQWAMIQNNLGFALARIGERESDSARLEEAVATLQAAPEELTRKLVPLQWATTQRSLGFALSLLGERESDSTRLEEAVAAFRAALEELTREHVPLDWAETQHYLGIALATLGARESNTKRLEAARECIEGAQRVYKNAGMDRYDEDLRKRLERIERLVDEHRHSR